MKKGKVVSRIPFMGSNAFVESPQPNQPNLITYGLCDWEKKFSGI